MNPERQAALATLRRIEAAIRRGIEPEDRHVLMLLHRRALAVLEAGIEHRQATTALADRIVELERQLASETPGRRAAIIRERLGLSRPRYYRLRSLASKRDR